MTYIIGKEKRMDKNVKLIYSSPLWLISNGIRYSHDNHHLSDTKETKESFITKTIKYYFNPK